MVADALAGKIDLIITKSVSRFARNTVDSLTTIRSLKEHNVECYFEKENIWTFDGKGELLLTIMSSLAQEESRSISENCTWGQRKRFADGKVTVPFKRFLGYDMGPDHNLVVNPEQAKLVKRIYGMFLQGQSPFQIARTLTEEGIPSPGGKDHWNPSNIKSILTNEKYKGDALLQKSFTVDFLTKKKKTNEGEIPQYYVKDNHEAIIDPETFEMVQTLMTTRTKGRNRKSSVSIFSSKVKCGDCGSWYGPKVWHSNDAYRKVIWQCNHKFDGQKCATPTLTEDEIKELFLRAANQVIDQKEQFIAIYEQVLSRSLDTTALESELSDLEAEINIAAELIEECIKENAHVALDQDEYQKRYDALVARFDKAKARHTEVTDLIAERMARKHQIEAYLKNLWSREPLTEFRETDWLAMVDYITVHSKKDIRVTFKDGTEIKAYGDHLSGQPHRGGGQARRGTVHRRAGRHALPAAAGAEYRLHPHRPPAGRPDRWRDGLCPQPHGGVAAVSAGAGAPVPQMLSGGSPRRAPAAKRRNAGSAGPGQRPPRHLCGGYALRRHAGGPADL